MGWFSGRGSLLGLQSSGYQLISARIEQYRLLLSECGKQKDEIEGLLTPAKDALENRLWSIIPYPKYDFAFARLFAVRNLLCQKLPLPDLIGTIVPEIRDDLDYPTVTSDQANQIKPVGDKLLAALAKQDQAAVGERTALEMLSQTAAQARSAHWLKVNMSRNRLLIMALIALALLICVNALTFNLMSSQTSFASKANVGWAFHQLGWLVSLFGILGGLTSALMTAESVDTKVSEYYLNRRLLYVRPIIGGVIALVTCAAIWGGFLSLAGVKADSPAEAFIVIAFIAGFAERAFVSQLLSLANVNDGDSIASKKATPVTLPSSPTSPAANQAAPHEAAGV